MSVNSQIKRARSIYKQRLRNYECACSPNVNICNKRTKLSGPITGKSREEVKPFSPSALSHENENANWPTTCGKYIKQILRHLSVIAPHALPIFPHPPSIYYVLLGHKRKNTQMYKHSHGAINVCCFSESQLTFTLRLRKDVRLRV